MEFFTHIHKTRKIYLEYHEEFWIANLEKLPKVMIPDHFNGSKRILVGGCRRIHGGGSEKVIRRGMRMY